MNRRTDLQRAADDLDRDIFYAAERALQIGIAHPRLAGEMCDIARKLRGLRPIVRAHMHQEDVERTSAAGTPAW